MFEIKKNQLLTEIIFSQKFQWLVALKISGVWGSGFGVSGLRFGGLQKGCQEGTQVWPFETPEH